DSPTKIMDQINLEFTGPVGIISAYWFGDTAISLKTLDAGLTWQPMNQPPNHKYTYIAFSIIDKEVIYAERLSNQYKSVDGGINWSLVRILPYSTVIDRGFKIFDATGLGYASCEYAQPFFTFYSDVADTSVYNGFYPPESYSFVD